MLPAFTFPCLFFAQGAETNIKILLNIQNAPPIIWALLERSTIFLLLDMEDAMKFVIRKAELEPVQIKA